MTAKKNWHEANLDKTEQRNRMRETEMEEGKLRRSGQNAANEERHKWIKVNWDWDLLLCNE